MKKRTSKRSLSYLGESSKNSHLWEAVSPEKLFISTSSLYCDMPGTRDWALLFFSDTTRDCAKLRKSRGVFLGCVRVSWDLLPYADSWSWILDQLSDEKSTRDCPKRPRRIRLAVHFACCVTRTSSKCRVAPLLRFLQRRRNSCPSSQSPPMLVRMKGRQKLSLSKRPAESFRGYAFAFNCRFDSNFPKIF